MEWPNVILAGNELASAIPNFPEIRDGVADINAWLPKKEPGVMVLLGLRRTGKTTMMLQAASLLSEEEFRKTAYISVPEGMTSRELNGVVGQLKKEGFKNFFVDEITRIEDISKTISVFPDIYARLGLRFVMTGTDSLAFILSRSTSLFDRCEILRTTVMPFAEHSRLTGMGLMDFVRTGGVLFGHDREESWAEYVNSAIIDNIENTLLKTGRDYRLLPLQILRSEGKLRNFIHRIFDNRSARLIIELLEKPFFPENPRDVITSLNRTDPENPFDKDAFSGVVQTLKGRFGITGERSGIRVEDIGGLDFFLKEMDVFRPVKIWYADGTIVNDVVFRQPGVATFQMRAITEPIAADRKLLSMFSQKELERVSSMIERAAMGRLFEDAVVTDITDALPEKTLAGKYIDFNGSEIDLIIDGADGFHLFEIKSAASCKASHFRHLKNQDFLAGFEKRMGKIASRNVICNAETRTRDDGIHILNATEVLSDIHGFLVEIKPGERHDSGFSLDLD